jgi:hypothetical protein
MLVTKYSGGEGENFTAINFQEETKFGREAMERGHTALLGKGPDGKRGKRRY